MPSIASTSRSGPSPSSSPCAAAAAAIGAPSLAVTLAPWTLLATDFSFAFGALRPGVHWWTELLRGNLLLSLVFANSVVPALAMALRRPSSALSRSRDGGERGWIARRRRASRWPSRSSRCSWRLSSSPAWPGRVVLGAASRPLVGRSRPRACSRRWLLPRGRAGTPSRCSRDPLAPAVLSREMLLLPRSRACA